MNSRTRSRKAVSIGSNQSAKSGPASSASGCRASRFVVGLVMAWSPARRANAGIDRVWTTRRLRHPQFQPTSRRHPCWWLEPLWCLLRRHVMSSTKIFADDTTLPVLDPGRGRTKTGRLWGYAIDDRPWGGATPPAVVYLYAEDRKGEHPAAHLAEFRGILQVDGYGGFKGLLAGRPSGEVRLAFCWAHCRRRFYEIHQATGSPLAEEALRRIGELYKV